LPPEPRISDAVRSFALPTGQDLFTELSASARLEDVGKGRRGATLTKVDTTGAEPLVPVVRTTTRYGSPAQRFRAVHERLARRIQELAALPVAFNNALIESYTNAYTKMGSHSDQALDLADGSFIAVFSCYQHPDAGPPRKLVFESKTSGDERLEDGGFEDGGFEIALTHHSVVVFSVESNRRLRHRIVLDTPVRTPDNQWLGVTFRTSKTFLRFHDGRPHLPQGARLRPADDEQRHEFYRLRRRENNETDFVYPPLTYTVSESDLMLPT
jgi:hypothetical protein